MEECTWKQVDSFRNIITSGINITPTSTPGAYNYFGLVVTATQSRTSYTEISDWATPQGLLHTSGGTVFFNNSVTNSNVSHANSLNLPHEGTLISTDRVRICVRQTGKNIQICVLRYHPCGHSCVTDKQSAESRRVLRENY